MIGKLLDVGKALLGVIKSMNGDTAKYATIGLVLLFLSSMFNAYVLGAPGPQTTINIEGGKGHSIIVQSPEFTCPTGWDRSVARQPSTDPLTDESLIVCESSNDRFTLTVRDEVVPEKVFDSYTGTWVFLEDVLAGRIK